MTRFQFIISSVVSFAATTAYAQGSALDLSSNLWQTYTNMRNVRAAESSAEGIWAATTGGVLLWNLEEQGYHRLTNTEGLSQNETTALGLDRNGRLWIGLSNGLIDVYDHSSESFTVINDYSGLGINDFFPVGDSMYIALSLGVSLYRADREEVKETYKNLGTSLQSGTAVKNLYINGRELWAATNSGIAKTSLDFPNLLAPESWTNYSTAHGLPSNTVVGFARFRGQIVTAFSNGIVQFNGALWQDIAGNIGSRDFKQVQSLILSGQEILLAATSSGLYSSDTPGVWQQLGQGVSNATGLVVDSRAHFWLTTSNAGLFELDAGSNSWVPREPDGPATNSITSVALDQQGNVWFTSGDGDFSVAFMVYDGIRWRNFNSSSNPVISNDCRHVSVLQNDERWIGTWGAGITIVRGTDLDNLEFSQINQANGLAGISSDPNFVVIPYFKQDAAGNVWICNYEAGNSNYVAVYKPDGRWQYFSRSEGIATSLLLNLEIESTVSSVDRIWLGTDDDGVRVIDYNGTLDDKSDDDLSGELDLDDNLLSVNVNSVVQDRDGFLWIGTDLGLNYWFANTVSSRFGLINDNVLVVKIDGRNNKWLGTSAGISVLSGNDNFSLSHITVENSPLVSSVITGLAFNTETGDVWIATTNGISKYRTPFTAPRPNLDLLSGYPNPFRVGGGNDRFIITNLAENSAVKIYQASGELVRTFSRDEVLGAQVQWDGRDNEKKLVPSGVYLFMAYIEETGDSAVGKVVVILR